MSSTKLTIPVTSLDETKRLADALAINLSGGEVIELVSDLGGGKTTFTRLLVEALASEDEPSSPSFTLENIYRCSNFNIHHFDFYRLDDPGIMAQELAEVLSDQQAVIMIEWARIVSDILPKQRLSIKIDYAALGRIFCFQAPAKLTYLLQGLN